MADRPSTSANILVFLPTLNDGELVDQIAAELRELSDRYTVLILDDGSDPRLQTEGAGLGCLTFRLPYNLGLGACTHIALDHALRHGYDVVVRVDADGQHPVDRIPHLIAPIEAGAADVVVGRRTNHQAGRGLDSWLRRLVKAYYAAVARILTGGRTPGDVNSGFFALNRKAAAVLNRNGLERYPEPQIFILACRERLRVAEIAIEQSERQFGTSTLNLVQAARMFYRFNMFALGELLRGMRQ